MLDLQTVFNAAAQLSRDAGVLLLICLMAVVVDIVSSEPKQA